MTEVAKERRQIQIGEATFKELKSFAEIDMGVTVPNGWNSAKIKAQLTAEGWEHPYILGIEAVNSAPVAPPPREGEEIEVEAEDTPEPEPDPEPVADPHATVNPITGKKLPPRPKEVAEPMCEIVVNEQSGVGGKRPYFAAVNGTGILLTRNKPIMVKLRYVNCLEVAKETRYELDEETGKNEPKDIHSVPFEKRQMPAQKDIDAWRKWEAWCEARDHIPLPRRRDEAA